MSALHRKLLRDLVHLRGQMIAISLVVACGVAVFVTTRTAYDSLLLSQASYYRDYRFADVFASLERAPESLARRIAEIPGVAAVRTRVVFDVPLDVPGLAEPATARLVSIPERRTPMLNDLYLRRGRYVEPGRRDEVIVGEAFALANRLELGDTLGAVLNGRWQRLRIVGVALSPEFVYEIRGGAIFPDNRRFGVLWMAREAMGPAFDLDGAFNDLVLALSPRANEGEVIAQLDRALELYGGLGAFGRHDQVSHRFLSDELAQNRVSGVVLPAIFLGVAAFLINIVLSRVVGIQREQIAVLKAFGYSDAAVALHFVEMALAAIVAGGLVGSVLGLWLGALINALYVDFYRFPVLHYVAGPRVVATAIAVAGGAGLLGSLGAVRRALRLVPAEAMRPELPPRFRSGLLERTGVQQRLPLAARMIARNIVRGPSRAAMAVVGIAFAVAILIVGRYFVDAIHYIADVQFRLVQRDDVTVTFQSPLPLRARYELAHLPGVLRTEPFRAVPVKLRFGHRSQRTALVGMEVDAQLHQLIDADLRPRELPEEGVLLTAKLADLLGATRGDRVTVEVLEGERQRLSVPIVGTVDELVGLSAYTNLRSLSHLMGEASATSGVALAVDPLSAPMLYAKLKEVPAISGVAIREVALASFEDTIARSMGIFTTVLIGFACVIAVAVVYNAARVALSERGRELASLRVLGFTRGEVGVMLLGEQALLTLAAVPLGFVLGYRICAAVADQYQWELFRLPLVVSPRNYAMALLIVLAAAVCSAFLVRRRLDRIDLVEVLKTRE